MRNIFYLMLILLVPGWGAACRKTDDSRLPDCDTSSKTVREIFHHKATIGVSNGDFVLVEEGSVDYRLRPCNLPAAFRQSGLKVIFSGKVKSTIQLAIYPCCTENLAISHIEEAP